MVPEREAIARSCSAASRAASTSPAGQPRAHERLERGRALGQAALGQAPQRALGLVHGAGRVAAVERQLGAHERREVVPVGRLEQPARLVQEALAPAQLGQPDHPVGDAVGMDVGQRAEVGAQLRLRRAPVAAPDEDVRVVRAAGGEGEPVRPLLAEALDVLAPLRRALEVAHPLAGVDEVAAAARDGVEVVELAGDGGRGRLVQAAHPFLDLALAHVGQPFEPERHHLDVDRPAVAADGAGGRRVGARAGGVVVDLEGEVPAQQRQPALLDPRLHPLEQALGALDPPEPDRHVGVEVALAEAQLQRDARRGARVAGAAVQPVGALQRAHRGLLLAEPPRGHAQALEPGRGRSLVDARLEGVARRLPLAGGQRGAPGFECPPASSARDGLFEHRGQDTPRSRRRSPTHVPPSAYRSACTALDRDRAARARAARTPHMRRKEAPLTSMTVPLAISASGEAR